MGVHTEAGILLTRALAPEPTAARFLGNRVSGSAPARGTGRRLAPTDVVPSAAAARREGGLIRELVVTESGVGFGVLLALGALDPADVMLGDCRAGDVAAVVAAGEPAPQPARTRQARVLAVAVAWAG